MNKKELRELIEKNKMIRVIGAVNPINRIIAKRARDSSGSLPIMKIGGKRSI